jgi:hypothetical protein
VHSKITAVQASFLTLSAVTFVCTVSVEALRAYGPTIAIAFLIIVAALSLYSLRWLQGDLRYAKVAVWVTVALICVLLPIFLLALNH